MLGGLPHSTMYWTERELADGSTQHSAPLFPGAKCFTWKACKSQEVATCFASGYEVYLDNSRRRFFLKSKHITFGYLGPPPLPIDVHHLRPSGFKTLVVNRDDRIVDGSASFWPRTLDTWSLCIWGVDAIQTGEEKTSCRRWVGTRVCSMQAVRKPTKDWVVFAELPSWYPRALSLVGDAGLHIRQVGNSKL